MSRQLLRKNAEKKREEHTQDEDLFFFDIAKEHENKVCSGCGLRIDAGQSILTNKKEDYHVICFLDLMVKEL